MIEDVPPLLLRTQVAFAGELPNPAPHAGLAELEATPPVCVPRLAGPLRRHGSLSKFQWMHICNPLL